MVVEPNKLAPYFDHSLLKFYCSSGERGNAMTALALPVCERRCVVAFECSHTRCARAGHHGCGKLYWGEVGDDGCRKADTYNHYYTVFHTPSEHAIDKVAALTAKPTRTHSSLVYVCTAGTVSDGDASAPLQWWEGAADV